MAIFRLKSDPVSGAAIPLVQVRNIKIDRLPSSWKLGPLSGLTLTELSSCPTLASRPTKLTFNDVERRVTLETTFQLASPERKHSATFEAHDVELESLISTAATRNVLEPLAGGTTSIEARGWITRELVHLDLSTELNGLQVAKSSGPLAGIDAAVWRQGLALVDAVRLDAEITGRWSNPKLSIVPHEFVQTFQKSLTAAGAKEIVAALESSRSPSVVNAGKAPATTPTVASTTPAASAATSLVPPAATALMPKPNLLSSAIPSPASRTTGANEPPTKPLTIQPMTMNPASIVMTNVTPPSITLPHAPNGTLLTNTAAIPFAPTSTGLTPLSPAATAISPLNAGTPLKALPTETFNVVAGEPWKEPNVVLGTPAPTSGVAAAAPSTPTAKPTTLSADVAAKATSNEATNSDESPKATASYPQEIASETSPTMGVPQPKTIAATTATPSSTNASAAAPKKPSTVAPIPTSAEAVAGLRQPLSVLDPNSTPGPINLTVGYDSERTSGSSTGGVQAATANAAGTTNRPTAARGAPGEDQVAARTTPRTIPNSAIDDPASDNTVQPTRKPAKPPVADNARASARREIEDLQSEPEAEPAPKKKSLLNHVAGLFGGMPNDTASQADESRPETSPRDDDSLEPKKPAKKMFPRIRALFGEAPEMLPPDNAQLPFDREVVPSTAEESGAASGVRTSGFDAAAQEQDETRGAPRPLNIPRTNDADGGEAKPLAETRTFTEEKKVDSDRAAAPSGPAQRPVRFTSAVNAEQAEPTTETTASQPNKTPSAKTSPTTRTAPKPTERLSAGESFYNRMVR